MSTSRGTVFAVAVALVALGASDYAAAQSEGVRRFCENVESELDRASRKLTKDETDFRSLVRSQEEYIEEHRQLIREAERSTRSRETLYRDYTKFLWDQYQRAQTLKGSITALSETIGLLSDQHDALCRFSTPSQAEAKEPEPKLEVAAPKIEEPTPVAEPITKEAAKLDPPKVEPKVPVAAVEPEKEEKEEEKKAEPEPAVEPAVEPEEPEVVEEVAEEEAVDTAKAAALADAVIAAQKPVIPKTGEECCSTANSHSSCWMNVEVTMRRSVTDGGPIRVIEAKETYWVGGDEIFVGPDVHKSKMSLAAKGDWPYGGNQTAGFTSISKPPCNGDALERRIDIKTMSCEKPANPDQTKWVNWREIVKNCDQ